MGFSCWKILLHPKVTVKVMEELEKEKEKCAGEMNFLREENARLVESNGTLTHRNEELGSEVERLRRELEEIRAELDERIDTEKQIREFEARLGQFETVKVQYEQRISRLRAKIIDMKKVSGDRNPEADEIAVIDMGTQTMPKKRVRAVVEERSEEDWLETLS